MTISHGNADVERMFPWSGRIVTEVSNKLKTESVNAILITVSYFRPLTDDIHLFPNGEALIMKAIFSRKKYFAWLDTDKKKKKRKN